MLTCAKSKCNSHESIVVCTWKRNTSRILSVGIRKKSDQTTINDLIKERTFQIIPAFLQILRYASYFEVSSNSFVRLIYDIPEDLMFSKSLFW